jgi:hypothetical protein
MMKHQCHVLDVNGKSPQAIEAWVEDKLRPGNWSSAILTLVSMVAMGARLVLVVQERDQ